MGQLERVLLIEANPRRPALAGDFGLSASAPGLADFVAGSATPEQCISHDSVSGIDVMSAGVAASQSQSPLSLLRCAPGFARLAARYDHIIIDTAPVQSRGDALVLAACADAVVYVVKANATRAKVAREGLRHLRATDASIIGVMLNQVDATSR